MPKFIVPVTWEMSHAFLIEADTLELALGKAGKLPLPEGIYVSGSFKVSEDEVVIMNPKTEDAYEEWLNQYYDDNHGWEYIQEHFSEFTAPSREMHITEDELCTAHTMGTLGTLIRKLDPIRFQVGFQDWNP